MSYFMPFLSCNRSQFCGAFFEGGEVGWLNLNSSDFKIFFMISELLRTNNNNFMYLFIGLLVNS